ncbi:hypothetical protein JXK06_02180 [Patescibacteria group bacterium]|nr:hypothetical protein [Patescibacteria group bacterium]
MHEVIRGAKIEDFKELPGSLWVLSTFFNPTQAVNKINNYRYFHQNLIRQGVKILTVECAFKDASFELDSNDADKLIQVRSDSILWHKERLLNIGLKYLPSECDKIAWLDADIIFLNNDWAKEVAKLLETYHFVKPFNRAIRLNKKETREILLKNNIKNLNLHNRPKYKNSEYSANQENLIIYMSVFGLCARRDIIQEIGFYDRFIVGNGDMVISGAILNEKPYWDILPTALEKDIEVWSKKASNLTANKGIAFIPDDILHLFHGRIANRNYYDRIRILKKRKFDPNQDLRINQDDCFEWASNKKRLQQQLFGYFKNRNEDDHFFQGIKIFIRERLARSLIYLFRFIDRQIGLIGIKLRKNHPDIYYFLKRK